MKHTQSSQVKERQIPEDEAQDIMKKNVEAKNKNVDPKHRKATL